MAGHTTAKRRRRIGLGAALAAGLAFAAAPYYAGCLKRPGDFHLSGDVTVAPGMSRRAALPNTMLFIVAENSGGVPVAVKRIINPQLPLDYQLLPGDLVLPGPAWRGPLTVKAHINTHGTVGLMMRGDLVGSHPSAVQSGDAGVHVVVDSEVSTGSRSSVSRADGLDDAG